jgi:hypothetical protein
MVYNNHFYKNLLESSPHNQIFSLQKKELWKSDLKNNWYRLLK